MGSQSVPALTAQQGVVQMRDLDRSLVQGIAWTGAAKWVGQLVAWASTLIVAISPATPFLSS